MKARQRVYNPAQLTPEERKALFAVRHKELGLLQKLVLKHKTDTPLQHTLVVAPRGMGKSTLTLRFMDWIVETDETAKHWQPIAFPEESYGVTSVGELWVEALSLLTRVTGNTSWSDRAEHLLHHEKDDARLEAATFDILMEYHKETGKVLVILLENLDLILDQLESKDDAHRLRSRLMDSKSILLIATSTKFDQHFTDDKQPFFEFFNTIRLNPLDQAECIALLEAIEAADPDKQTGKISENTGRIAVVRELTGGSPRLIALLYRMLKESPAGRAWEDLSRLIDDQTPYFQSRIEALSSQQRKVFHALAKLWAPALAKEIAEATRLTSSHVSAQLKQLLDRGYIEKTRKKGEKRDRYSVQERFYNIYYLFRFTTDEKNRLRKIVDLLELLFGPDSLVEMFQTTLKALIAEAAEPKLQMQLDILVDKQLQRNAADLQRTIESVTNSAETRQIINSVLRRLNEFLQKQDCKSAMSSLATLAAMRTTDANVVSAELWARSYALVELGHEFANSELDSIIEPFEGLLESGLATLHIQQLSHIAVLFAYLTQLSRVKPSNKNKYKNIVEKYLCAIESSIDLICNNDGYAPEFFRFISRALSNPDNELRPYYCEDWVQERIEALIQATIDVSPDDQSIQSLIDLEIKRNKHNQTKSKRERVIDYLEKNWAQLEITPELILDTVDLNVDNIRADVNDKEFLFRRCDWISKNISFQSLPKNWTIKSEMEYSQLLINLTYLANQSLDHGVFQTLVSLINNDDTKIMEAALRYADLATCFDFALQEPKVVLDTLSTKPNARTVFEISSYVALAGIGNASPNLPDELGSAIKSLIAHKETGDSSIPNKTHEVIKYHVDTRFLP